MSIMVGLDLECYSKRSIKIRSEILSSPVPVIPPGEGIGPAPTPPVGNKIFRLPSITQTSIKKRVGSVVIKILVN